MRPKVLILSRDRPLYLWASLDSLFRYTKTPVDFVLLDNNSQDPLVDGIIDAFRRRGMFHEIVRSPINDGNIVQSAVTRLAPSFGPFFLYAESDVMIEPTGHCWAETMLGIMETHPKLAMLGSQVDKRDFIDPEWAAAQFGCQPEDIGDLVKATSPERSSYTPPGSLADPHNPPGRLLAFRTEAVLETGMGSDMFLYDRLRERGWECAITGDVVHRHLSLQNYFDYPNYDMVARQDFFAGRLPVGSK